MERAFGWNLSSDDDAEVNRILRETIKDPVGPEFMAPPPREPLAAEIHSNEALLHWGQLDDIPRQALSRKWLAQHIRAA